MQVIKILSVSALLTTSLSIGSFAQVIRENERGEKIIVYPDGSWQYFSTITTEDQKQKIAKDPYGVYGDSLTRFPVFTGIIGPMDDPMPITEEDARKIAFRRSQLALEATRLANQRAYSARENRKKFESEYANMTASGNADPKKLSLLFKKLEQARKDEKMTSDQVLQAYDESKKADELTKKVDLLNLPEFQQKSVERSVKTTLESNAFYDRLAAADLKMDANPPSRRCEVSYTDRFRKDLKRELLFTHTDERLRPYLKGKDYLKCEAYLSSSDQGELSLNLGFTFAYPNAREAYGFIENGSILTIELFSGDKVVLRSGGMDGGKYDTTTEELTYEVKYRINADIVSILSIHEISAITVFWSSGFERYESYQVDFFIHQMGCLKSNNGS
jgi:hypothetical protein